MENISMSMKNICFFLLSLFLMGCAGSPSRTAFEAEKNRMDMMDVHTNMSMQELRDQMGMPKKVERRFMDGIEYEIWYYITRGVNLDQTRYIDENFTPFVFYGNCLRGWGWKFYNHLFDINNARFKKEEYQRDKYVPKNEDWPTNEHKIITPYESNKSQSDGVEKVIKEFIESGKEKPAESQIQPPDNKAIQEPTKAFEKPSVVPTEQIQEEAQKQVPEIQPSQSSP